jgi:hypothetical protein
MEYYFDNHDSCAGQSLIRRSDGADVTWSDEFSGNSVPADFARKLERELDQLCQDEQQAQSDLCRALGERNDARAELAAERALADRLAHCLDNLQYEYLPIEAMKAFEKWKEARRGTP